MARVKLSEYGAKSLLVDGYAGIAIRAVTLNEDSAKLKPAQDYIVKVDQGVKKRGKQGLVRLNVKADTAKAAVRELMERGYEQFIAEPMYDHKDSEESYLSIERMRDGYQILYSPRGGVDIEEHPESVKTYHDIDDVPLPKEFLQKITTTMEREHMSFLEINPLVVRGDECALLDAAVLVDSAGATWASWSEDDIVAAAKKTDAEQTIADLNDSSAASFSFRVLNPNGSVWLLLSGGGASITIADEAANRGKAELIGNYGEYSGGPTREETMVYTEAVLNQVMASKAKKKAIVIAGGVANFTDVKKTFAGIIDALTPRLDDLKSAGIKVYVRRGGPNEAEGLAMMEAFLKKSEIFGSVHGSDAILTVVVDEALEYVDA